MANLFWVLTIIGSLIGTLLLFSSFLAEGAPQQAALAAMAVGFAVLPYCIARSFNELKKKVY